MNKFEIADLFIFAAIVDERLPVNAAPKDLKAAWVQHAPLTEEDQRKWFVREETDLGPSRLMVGDDPVKDWWLEFWDGRRADESREDYEKWLKANELVKLVSSIENRRALWAWAKSKACTLSAKKTRKRRTRRRLFGVVQITKRIDQDVSFAAWCRSEGIHEVTGKRRVDRAIAVIEQQLARRSSPNIESCDLGVLPVGPVFEHISDIIAADASNENGEHGRTFSRDRETVFAKEDTVFNWREFRNEARRAKARRQKAEAA